MKDRSLLEKGSALGKGLWSLCLLISFVLGLDRPNAAAQSSNILQRVPNTTLQMPQTPQSSRFALTNAFGNLVFSQPMEIRTPPGETNRLFVVEQGGRIWAITNLAAPNKTLFLDLTRQVFTQGAQNLPGLTTMAFHPGYATNRFFFVGYNLITQTADGSGPHYRVSRFSVSPDNPNLAPVTNEVPLITQIYPNGTAGLCDDLLFGPDGYLYIAVVDPNADAGGSLQQINRNLFGGILRIDVDQKAANLVPNPGPAVSTNYAIPADNPFVGVTSFNGVAVNPASVRTEFYAVGLRNPWRMAFDAAAGLLYVGDPGTSLEDAIDVVVKGGNYGWPYREGTVAGPQVGRTPRNVVFINPIYQIRPPSAIIGGIAYHGQNVPTLQGTFICGDWVNGPIWALRYAGTNMVPAQLLVSEIGVAAFGTDPRNGDVLPINYNSGIIRRLVSTTNVVGTPLPPTLADTGVFADLPTLTPNPGMIGYDLNLPSWADNAQKSYWFSVPNLAATIGFSRDGNWSFPVGTVWVQHFDLQLTNGASDSVIPVETRVLVRNNLGVYGASYRWGGSLTNAVLVPPGGMDETFSISDGGTIRTQTWHYPSQSQCLDCHNPLAGYALGFNTAQLNHLGSYGGVAQNQIQALSDAGYFSQKVTEQYTLPALAKSTNAAISVDFRVHSYLAANCAFCHQPGGIGGASFDVRLPVPLRISGLINGIPNDSLGDPANQLIAPGSLQHSVAFGRLATPGADYMPPLGSTVPDLQALDLFAAWITNRLAQYRSYADWQLFYYGSTNSSLAAPNQANLVAYLTGTNPLLRSNQWSPALVLSAGQAQIQFPGIANLAYEVQWTTNIPSGSYWQTLDVPENQPEFSATNYDGRLQDPSTGAPARFYRVRILEP